MSKSNSSVTAPSTQLIGLIGRASAAGVLRRVVFSKSEDPSRVRATLEAKVIRGRAVWQIETFYADNKARQENLEPSAASEALEREIARYRQVNLLTLVGDCEFKRSSGGTQTLLRGGKLSDALASGLPTRIPMSTGGNNREKKHVLDGTEPFLRALGVSGADGRVYDKKQAKFRQINRFLELLRDVEDRLPSEGTLCVCDLCCGKSYLSFAVYHYLTAIKGRKVRMIGVDLKPDVMEDCNAVARQVGFDGMTFLCGDVGAFEPENGMHVHLVVSLHACDTATDLVLGKAMKWQSEVILSTPCCHHELNHTLDCPELSCLADYSMLRQKLCDAATDAMRLLLLEANGYTVAALELIDPEETPKNVMLRAIRKQKPDTAAMAAARARYEDAVRYFIRTPGEAQDVFLRRGE